MIFWHLGFGRDRGKKGPQDRVIHKLIDNSDGIVELVGLGRHRGRREREQAVADMCREVDLAGAARQYVSMHQLLPERTHVLVSIAGPGRLLAQDVGVGKPVTVSVHGELKRLEAVVLRQERHEGAQRVRRGCCVGQDVSQ